MAETAIALGHEFMVLTDHSPRLTIANGLTAERLREQLQVVAGLNAELAPFRTLTGIECDILLDGGLDQERNCGADDIVVASLTAAAHGAGRDDAADGMAIATRKWTS